ncbi:MAG TPA: response regulator [Stellaceae bacterium]|nr:response regulator [Stellaceae bacterium]
MTKILVIDDDVIVRETIIQILEDHGYTVVSAEDGERGLAAFRTERPDLVITDREKGHSDHHRNARRAAGHEDHRDFRRRTHRQYRFPQGRPPFGRDGHHSEAFRS